MIFTKLHFVNASVCCDDELFWIHFESLRDEIPLGVFYHRYLGNYGKKSSHSTINLWFFYSDIFRTILFQNQTVKSQEGDRSVNCENVPVCTAVSRVTEQYPAEQLTFLSDYMMIGKKTKKKMKGGRMLLGSFVFSAIFPSHTYTSTSEPVRTV